MVIPINYGKPTRRPGAYLIADANWHGDTQDLVLEVDIFDSGGQQNRMTFPCTGEDGMGQICLPGTATIEDISREAIIASVRMAMFLGNYSAWSFEAIDAFTKQEGAKNFQTAIGNSKIVDTRIGTDDQNIEFDIKKYGTSQPIRTIATTVDEISKYSFEPVYQMNIIPGAVEWKYSGYIHDPDDNKTLTENQKQDIIDFLMSDEFQPWV